MFKVVWPGVRWKVRWGWTSPQSRGLPLPSLLPVGGSKEECGWLVWKNEGSCYGREWEGRKEVEWETLCCGGHKGLSGVKRME